MSEHYHKLAPVDSRGVVDIVDSGGRVACIFPPAGRRRDATFKLADTCLAALNAAEESKRREGLLERAEVLIGVLFDISSKYDSVSNYTACNLWLAEYQLTKGESE